MNVRAAFVRLGRRRAKRVSRWFGAAGRLPNIGRALQLSHVVGNETRGYELVGIGQTRGRFELRGDVREMEYACRMLADQERCERRDARRSGARD